MVAPTLLSCSNLYTQNISLRNRVCKFGGLFFYSFSESRTQFCVLHSAFCIQLLASALFSGNLDLFFLGSDVACLGKCYLGHKRTEELINKHTE